MEQPSTGTLIESTSGVNQNDIRGHAATPRTLIPRLWWRGGTYGEKEKGMLKNTMRGVLGLILTAAATWLANYIVDQVFGPDEENA